MRPGPWRRMYPVPQLCEVFWGRRFITTGARRGDQRRAAVGGRRERRFLGRLPAALVARRAAARSATVRPRIFFRVSYITGSLRPPDPPVAARAVLAPRPWLADVFLSGVLHHGVPGPLRPPDPPVAARAVLAHAPPLVACPRRENGRPRAARLARPVAPEAPRRGAKRASVARVGIAALVRVFVCVERSSVDLALVDADVDPRYAARVVHHAASLRARSL